MVEGDRDGDGDRNRDEHAEDARQAETGEEGDDEEQRRQPDRGSEAPWKRELEPSVYERKVGDGNTERFPGSQAERDAPGAAH